MICYDMIVRAWSVSHVKLTRSFNNCANSHTHLVCVHTPDNCEALKHSTVGLQGHILVQAQGPTWFSKRVLEFIQVVRALLVFRWLCHHVADISKKMIAAAKEVVPYPYTYIYLDIVRCLHVPSYNLPVVSGQEDIA